MTDEYAEQEARDESIAAFVKATNKELRRMQRRSTPKERRLYIETALARLLIHRSLSPAGLKRAKTWLDLLKLERHLNMSLTMLTNMGEDYEE